VFLCLRSPADEDGVHDSFSQLIQEQCHGLYDVIEMTPLDLEEEESRGQITLVKTGSDIRQEADRAVCVSEDVEAPVYQRSDSDAPQQTDHLIGERWSSDTLEVLSSMPSRTIGQCVFEPRSVALHPSVINGWSCFISLPNAKLSFLSNKNTYRNT